MEVSEVTGVIALIISVAGVYLVVRQLKMAREATEADHARRKKEATFNAFNAIREEFRLLDHSVRDQLELSVDDSLSPEHLEQIKKDTELGNRVRAILSYIYRSHMRFRLMSLAQAAEIV